MAKVQTVAPLTSFDEVMRVITNPEAFQERLHQLRDAEASVLAKLETFGEWQQVDVAKAQAASLLEEARHLRASADRDIAAEHDKLARRATDLERLELAHKEIITHDQDKIRVKQNAVDAALEVARQETDRLAAKEKFLENARHALEARAENCTAIESKLARLRAFLEELL